MSDKTQTENTDAESVQNNDKDKRSVMDRITDELNNPSEETERRFQEYIANNVSVRSWRIMLLAD